jgi:NADPH:quinone reductase-like Zn-dependent oxidoreductase
MKAIVYTKYGSADVVQLRDIEKPAPKDNEVLVKVMAASANAYDWHFLSADIFLIRLMGGLLKPKNNRLGADMAGRVEAVGSAVKQFKPGDEVFGEIGAWGNGAFAEYVCVPERAFALKPANLSFERPAGSARRRPDSGGKKGFNQRRLRRCGHICSADCQILRRGSNGGVQHR